MAALTVLQLKEAGNALFVKQDYSTAHEKYSEAIEIDEKNAILLANRALHRRRNRCKTGEFSCWDFSLGYSFNVVLVQATIVDPGYAKGWSRLAAAHEALTEWGDSVMAWQKAIDALAKPDLNPAELKQKGQYAAALKLAKERVKKVAEESAAVLRHSQDSPPWQLASEMMPEIRAAGIARISSSAWVITAAHNEFKQGVEYMTQLKRITIKGTSKDPKEQIIHGHGYASPALDGDDWFKNFDDQVFFESQRWDAWSSETLEVIIQGARNRQKAKGWANIQPALNVTVRAWIMRALFESELKGAPHVAVEILRKALDLLDWGRQCWPNVSWEDRGVIFEPHFVRGVRVMYLNALKQAYLANPGLSSPFPLENLFKEAVDLLKETLGNPRKQAEGLVDPGFLASFHRYPAGEAHAVVGFYYVQMAKYSSNPAEKFAYHFKAGDAYIEAGKLFPQDDEKHSWYFSCALEQLVPASAPIELANLVASRIRQAMPMMQRIWANSALAKQGRDTTIEKNLKKIDTVTAMVNESKKKAGEEIAT
ncbi:hypothetical protein HYDPIDRAFT_26423 [Hydnomerulius pinastri MD-312]|nr:hypothetical protein HYDPIDRAFT_26423 [Hydnomerulius pinastri MD-312]